MAKDKQTKMSMRPGKQVSIGSINTVANTKRRSPTDNKKTATSGRSF